MSKDFQPYPLERPFWSFIVGLSAFLLPYNRGLLLLILLVIIALMIKMKQFKYLLFLIVGCLWSILFSDHKPTNLTALGGQIKVRVIDTRIIDGKAGSQEIQVELLNFVSHAKTEIKDKKILLQSPRTKKIFYGDVIEAEGALIPIVSHFPSEKAYHKHLNNQGYYRIFLPSSEDELTIESVASLNKKILRFRDSLLMKIKEGVQSENNYRILAAMLFGLKQELNSEQKDTLRKSGLMHIFAVSGLHVGIVSVLILYLMRFVMIPVWKRYMLLPLILIPYLIMTGLPASGLRAWVMISVWAMGMCLKRSSISLNSLYCAGFIILLFNPMQLLLVGFQFSFLVIFCLLCSSKMLDDLCQIINEKNIWGGRTLYHIEHMKNNFIKAFLISAIAFICSFAITIHLSANSNPFSLTINLICIFLAAPLILCSLLATIAPVLFPILNGFTEFFAGLAKLSAEFALKPGVLSGIATLLYSLTFMLIIRLTIPAQHKALASGLLIFLTYFFIQLGQSGDKIIICRAPGQEQSELGLFVEGQALLINSTDYASSSFMSKEMDKLAITNGQLVISNRRKSSARGVFNLIRRDRLNSIYYLQEGKHLTAFQKYLNRQCFENEIPIYFENNNSSQVRFKDNTIIWKDFKIKIFSYKTGLCLINISSPRINITRELPISNRSYIEEFYLD